MHPNFQTHSFFLDSKRTLKYFKSEYYWLPRLEIQQIQADYPLPTVEGIAHRILKPDNLVSFLEK